MTNTERDVCPAQLRFGSRVEHRQDVTMQCTSLLVSCQRPAGHTGFHLCRGTDYIREKLVNGEVKPVQIRQKFSIGWGIEDLTDTDGSEETEPAT